MIRKLYRALTEKSWEHQPTTAEGYPVAESQGLPVPPQKVALVFFLCVVAVMFTLFAVAYYIRMELDDWRPMPESNLLWLNTAVLFMASIVLQALHSRLKAGNEAHLKAGMVVGALLTFGFVYGQVSVWQIMQAEGYYMYNNPANSFFYVLTGIHALHILGGLLVWLHAGVKVFSGAGAERIKLSVELCALYWHFLLLVWLVLFGLMSFT